MAGDDEQPRSKRARVQESSSLALLDEVEDVDYSELFPSEGRGAADQRRLSTEDLVLNGDHYIHTTGAPTKHNYNLRWYERLGSSCIPSASFSYEITFTPDVDDLFFTTQWQYLPYSVSRFDRYITYCVVKSVASPVASIVAEGDLVLKVNGQDLVQRPGDCSDLNDLASRLMQRNTMRVVRFLRTSAHTHSSLSVAEVLLYLEEKAVPAKFCCKYLTRTSANTKPVLESTFVDLQLPASVKKMLQGQRVSWQSLPSLPAGPALASTMLATATAPAPANPSSYMQQNAPQGPSMSAPMVTVQSLEKYDNKQHRNVCSYSLRAGVYRDRNKYVVIYAANVLPQLPIAGDASAVAGGSGSSSREKVLYNLGRYDSEEDAARVLNEAKESARASGGIFIPRHFLLGYRAPSAAAPPMQTIMTGSSIMGMMPSAGAAASAAGSYQTM